MYRSQTSSLCASRYYDLKQRRRSLPFLAKNERDTCLPQSYQHAWMSWLVGEDGTGLLFIINTYTNEEIATPTNQAIE